MLLLPVRQSSNIREAKVLAAGSLVEEIHELLFVNQINRIAILAEDHDIEAVRC